MAPTLSTTPTRAVLEELFPIGTKTKVEGEAGKKLAAIATLGDVANDLAHCVNKPGEGKKFAGPEDDLPPEHALRVYLDNGKNEAGVSFVAPDVNIPRGDPDTLKRMLGGLYFLRTLPHAIAFGLEGHPASMLITAGLTPLTAMKLTHAWNHQTLRDMGLWIAFDLLQRRYPEIRWPVAQYLEIRVDTENCEVEVTGYKI